MTTRNAFSVIFGALGLVATVAGVGLEMPFLVFTGISAIAIAVRYYRGASFREFVWFLMLLTAVAALELSTNSRFTHSPLMGALPLILSYILEYLDEHRRNHAPINKDSENITPQDGITL